MKTEGEVVGLNPQVSLHATTVEKGADVVRQKPEKRIAWVSTRKGSALARRLNTWITTCFLLRDVMGQLTSSSVDFSQFHLVAIEVPSTSKRNFEHEEHAHVVGTSVESNEGKAV